MSISPDRILILNHEPIHEAGQFVIYRMQASVRIKRNLALYEAARLSRVLKKPLKVFFHINIDFPEANYRHFQFLMDGLEYIEHELVKQGVVFELLIGKFEDCFNQVGSDAAVWVTDKGYLRIQRNQQAWLAKILPCRLIEVEDNLVVPIESVSQKAEWAARTIRPKLMSKMSYFQGDGADFDRIDPFPLSEQQMSALSELHLRNARIRSEAMMLLRRIKPLSIVNLKGGEAEALSHLSKFITTKLADYPEARNYPELQATSRLSPYLHFGMISPLTIWDAVDSLPGSEPFLEQLIIRRELAHNYIWFTSGYDTYEALPSWSLKTLNKHKNDRREYLYSSEVLDKAETHDRCWNAAMHEMIETGYMENTMRMYWGKKLIEWSVSPEEAYARICYLNNRYLLDGRDANSYAGIGWCFGLHDRPWQERPVFGLVRYMNEAGLRRKYDIDRYIIRFGG